MFFLKCSFEYVIIEFDIGFFGVFQKIVKVNSPFIYLEIKNIWVLSETSWVRFGLK